MEVGVFVLKFLLEILHTTLVSTVCVTGEDSELPTTGDNSCNFCCDQPTVSPHNCNIYINETRGQFEAPPYPYTTCTWIIEVPADHEVLVRLTQVSEFTGERFVIAVYILKKSTHI